MKTYSIGINTYWRTAGIAFDEVPAGLYYLKLFAEWVCSIFPEILLPRLKFKLKDYRDWGWTPKRDGWTDLQDWFGDTQTLFHLYICTMMFDLTQRYTKSVHINLPYNFLKEMFPAEFKSLEEEADYLDEADLEHIEKTKKIAEWTDGLFRIVYEKLNGEYSRNSLR